MWPKEQTPHDRLKGGKDVEMSFDLSGRREGHPCWIPLGGVALEEEDTQPLYVFSRVLSVQEPTGSERCSPPDVKI